MSEPLTTHLAEACPMCGRRPNRHLRERLADQRVPSVRDSAKRVGLEATANEGQRQMDWITKRPFTSEDDMAAASLEGLDVERLVNMQHTLEGGFVLHGLGEIIAHYGLFSPSLPYVIAVEYVALTTAWPTHQDYTDAVKLHAESPEHHYSLADCRAAIKKEME